MDPKKMTVTEPKYGKEMDKLYKSTPTVIYKIQHNSNYKKPVKILIPIIMDPEKMTESEPKYGKEMDKLYKSKMYERCAHFGDKRYLFPIMLYKTIEQSLRSVQIRNDDVWLGGFPRSGTHWLSEMTWLLGNDLNYDEANRIQHRNRILFLDYDFSSILRKDEKPVEIDDPKRRIEVAPSPRYLKSHCPLSLLPPDLLDTAKMIYIARDPRDVAVSFYHFLTKHIMFKFAGDFKTYWKHFMNDNVVYCPYFTNIKEYWGQRHHPNLLFLFYEEMHEDLPNTVRRVAKFLGRDYSDVQFETLCDYIQFINMKKNESVNTALFLGDDRRQLVRKGEVGGWRQYFDEEMTRDAEIWIAENLKDTDLKYPSMI